MNYYFIFDSIEKPTSILLDSLENTYHIPTVPGFDLKPYEVITHLQNKVEIKLLICQKRVQSYKNYSWVKLDELDSLPENQGAYLCRVLGAFWSEFALSQNSLIPSFSKLPHFLQKIDPQKEVFLYGGSFNPWHKGHEACIEQCPTENVIIIPDFNPWKKETSHFSTPCRWESFKNLALMYKNKGYSFFPGFWGRTTPNPTSSWIATLNYKKVSLVMGDDNFMAIEKWNNLEIILDTVHRIYIVPRNYTKKEINQKKNELSQIFQKNIFKVMSTHNYQDISSTYIRNFQKVFY